ncbi:MAG: NlpC/P60 family protein [Sulfitobacter sp.]
MSDPRAAHDPARVTQESSRCITTAFCDLLRTPDGPRDRQLLFGQDVTLLDERDGWAYVRSARDGYLGYVRSETHKPHEAATHYICAPCTHIYETANLKSRDILGLSHLSRITARSESNGFIEMSQGFIPKQHLAPVGHIKTDPAGVAAHYLGTDYLWGGNTRWGIDCSGLVQAALLACGIPCPGDSDQQMIIGEGAHAPYRRNDLLFWKGHVALVSDPDTMIHANAHAMAVNYEPIKDAIDRIQGSGGGPVTAHRRI